jgi:N-acetylglucosaminyl-diphospho-decaprenol L-rhamnosyltransferase
MNQQPAISISIVSHQQGALVVALLSDIAAHCALPLEIILTVNVPETLSFDAGSYPFPVKVINNAIRKGFGANHNAAFAVSRSDHFCVLNPDIRFEQDPFPVLLDGLSDPAVGVIAPLVLGPDGQIEDSARRFPTLTGVACKAFRGTRDPDYAIEQAPIRPDWVAGMFMLWRADMFRQIGGFDEGFFLYYEDVDACNRLRRAGFDVTLIPAARVTHYARRESHRNLRYLWWHLTSMLRFFWKRFVG